jgi:hypothetical protein
MGSFCIFACDGTFRKIPAHIWTFRSAIGDALEHSGTSPFWTIRHRRRPKPCISVHRPLPFLSTAGEAAASAQRGRHTEGQSCAFVLTIAHDEIENPQKSLKSEQKKSAFPPDCCNSFCALLTTIAQKDLSRGSCISRFSARSAAHARRRSTAREAWRRRRSH